MGTADRVREYLSHNAGPIARDLLVATLWVTGVRWLFVTNGYAEWLFYVVLFGGLIVYAAVVPGAPEADDGE